MNSSVRLMPIDIHYNKLLDWLIDRRHCQTGWQVEAKSIHEKLREATKSMPNALVEHVNKLPDVEYITYFHCLDIVELLKVSEVETKNFMGQYSSQVMKNWQEVVRLFEKDSIYLPDCASFLMRYVNYEIPAIKRQIGKCQQTQRECSKKESEHVASATNFRNKYCAMCQDLKIQGVDVHSELKMLVRELPPFYNTVCEAIGHLEKCVEYYTSFVGFVAQSADQQRMLPMICLIQEHGNATVYQYRSGTAPDKVIVDVKEEVGPDKEDLEFQVDWRGGTNPSDGSLPSSGMDSSVAARATTSDTVTDEIDFRETEDAIDIDWGTTGDIEQQDIEITVESTGHEEGVIVSGEEAETVLSNTQTRNELIDELLELESFFAQRLVELKSEPDIVSVNQFQSAPQLLQMQSQKLISDMQSHVTHLLMELTSQRMHHLFMIKRSPRYVERLADSLQQQLHLADKMERAALSAQERRSTALQQQREMEPQLEKLVERTKQLQEQVSQSISKRYDNRIVNIMGEINSI